MNKLVKSASIAAVGLLTFASVALAASNPKEFSTEMKTELGNPDCTAGDLVLDVDHAVVNDIDSGFYGYWAYDTYTRNIKVYEFGNDVHCAVVHYRGNFDAVEGQYSPGEGVLLDGNEDGVFKGGYTAKIRGPMKENPDYPTTGNLGTFDYGCDIANPSSCNYWSWVSTYFEPGYSFAYDWWGWLYLSPNHGWWINGSTGSAGDIS